LSQKKRQVFLLKNFAKNKALCTARLYGEKMLKNTSLFSFLRQLTTWHCPHLTAARRCCGMAAAEHQPCSNRSISPARRRAHSSKHAAAVLSQIHNTTLVACYEYFLQICRGTVATFYR